MLNTPLPPNFYNLLRFIASFMWPNIPDWGVSLNGNLETHFFNKEYEDDADTPMRIKRLGLSVSSFCNLEYIYSVLMFLVVMNLFLQLINSCNSSKSVFLIKLRHFIYRNIWYYIEANFTLIFASILLDISSTNFSMNEIKYTSFVFSLLETIILIIIIFYMFHLLNQNQPTPRFISVYNYYFVDISLDNKRNFYYHHITYLKKILVIFMLVFAQDIFEL